MLQTLLIETILIVSIDKDKNPRLMFIIRRDKQEKAHDKILVKIQHDY